MSFKISVITPTYNAADTIETAIWSVLSQNYSNYEHIIVDGESTDDTVDILKKYKHLKWISEADKGQADAMNKGFNYSTGDIIVFLNADDYFFASAFNKVIPAFQNNASSDTANPLRFMLSANGIVRIEGQAEGSSGGTIFTLPVQDHNKPCICF